MAAQVAADVGHQNVVVANEGTRAVPLPATLDTGSSAVAGDVGHLNVVLAATQRLRLAIGAAERGDEGSERTC